MNTLIKFILFFTLISPLFAVKEKIEITSNTFVADDKKKITEFIGNVKVKKGEDTIEAERLIVTLSPKNEPLRYVAEGKVKLLLTTENGSRYKGSAYRAVYNSQKQQYELNGNVKIMEVKTERELQGDRIVLDQLDGKAQVFGKDNKPVKFIFSVDTQ